MSRSCIAGAGQPFVIGRARPERSEGMYNADKMSNVRTSQANPVTEALYNDLLQETMRTDCYITNNTYQ